MQLEVACRYLCLIFQAVNRGPRVIQLAQYFTQLPHSFICCRSVNAQHVCHCISSAKQTLDFLAIWCRLLVQPSPSDVGSLERRFQQPHPVVGQVQCNLACKG